MWCSVNCFLASLTANHFHNIDFTTTWPSYLRDVVSQHPEGRPYTLTFRKHRANVNPSILETLLPLGDHSGRGVLISVHILTLGFNNQVSILDKCIGVVGGIILELIIPPST